ncbi:MAG: CPBP family intramembrane metalloprotease [Prevotella sp.]|nr:CPBP family intramembrane metalloprotease [Candidatus Equicola faecalis]
MKNAKLALCIAVAAVLWFIMFSPWTAPHINFWYMMTASAAILITLSVCFGEWKGRNGKRFSLPFTLFCAVAIAVALWMAFWIGDKLSQLMFDFARPQVDLIYSIKGSTSKIYIALALLFIIGPAEELFWRGYIQEFMQQRLGKNLGFVVATLVYTLIHIWSFNFMLIMAALVCGVCWGLLYRIDRRLLPALIISHALWDTAAFVVFPF